MRYRIFFQTSYQYDFSSGRGAILEGIASRTSMDAEGDIIRSYDEDSLQYLSRWGKLNFDHRQTTIGQVLEAKVLPVASIAEKMPSLAKSYADLEEGDNLLFLRGQLFPLHHNSHPDLQEVYHLIANRASIGFSIEGRPGQIRKSQFLAKNGKARECRIITDLKLHPRIAVTPTPVHPDAAVIIVKSFAKNSPSANHHMEKCPSCAYILVKAHGGYCPRCGNIIL